MHRPIQRREFLKNSAVLAAGLSLPLLSGCATSPGRKPKGAVTRPGPADRVNLGIVGFGTIAQDTIGNFLGDPRVQVVAVADPVKELPNYGYKGERTGGRLVG